MDISICLSCIILYEPNDMFEQNQTNIRILESQIIKFTPNMYIILKKTLIIDRILRVNKLRLIFIVKVTYFMNISD